MAGSLVTGVGAQAALVVSGILVARLLGVEDRGYLALLVLIPTIVSLVVGLGLPIGVTYFIASEEKRVRAIARSLAPVMAAQLLLIPIVHLLALITLTRGYPSSVLVAGLPTLVVGPATLVHSYGLGFLQGLRRFRLLNILRPLPATFWALAVLALSVVGEEALLAAAITWGAAMSIAGIAAVALAAMALRRTASPSGPMASAPPRREVLVFGLKGMLGATPPSEAFRLDQAVVGLFLSPIALGLYVASIAFANLPRFLALSVGMIAYPQVAAHSDRVEAHRSMWRFVALGAGLSLAVVGTLELSAGRLVPLLFGAEFAEAVPLTRIVLIAGFFWSVRRVLTDGARGAGLPFAGSAAEIASWIVLPAALPLLVPLAGVEGVAIALALSAMAGLGALVVLVERSYRRHATMPGSGPLVTSPEPGDAVAAPLPPRSGR